MSKVLEYKVLTLRWEDLESTLNIYAQDGYRADHFFPPQEDQVAVVLSRKQKSRKRHHEVFEDDDL